MADRIFAGVLLLVVIAYSIIAFTVIRAPFQYDPLGPESWPQILGVVSIVCLIPLMLRPEVDSFGLPGRTWKRIVALIVMLFGYAYLFQPLGFVLATFLFCTVLSLMLGASWLRAVVFGLATGVIGFFVCTTLLELNLPAGVLSNIL